MLLKAMITLLFVFKSNFLIASPDPSPQNLKILVLIIASDNSLVYQELQKIWKAYMHLDREHIEAYFIKGNAELKTAYQIVDDTIWSKTVENYAPGILNKTVMSLEAILPHMDEFDYVLRTNLSSFYVFPRLLEFVKTLPKKRCYCGVPWITPTITFASGAGFIMSLDMAEILVSRKTELWDNASYPDDVVIGMLFEKENIEIISSPRFDVPSIKSWKKQKKRIPENQFHFRVKNRHDHLRASEEVSIQKKLVKMFYDIKL